MIVSIRYQNLLEACRCEITNQICDEFSHVIELKFTNRVPRMILEDTDPLGSSRRYELSFDVSPISITGAVVTSFNVIPHDNEIIDYYDNEVIDYFVTFISYHNYSTRFVRNVSLIFQELFVKNKIDVKLESNWMEDGF